MKRLSPEIIFESDHLSQDLGRKSVQGGMATMTAQGIRFAVGLGGTMVLARLLTPNDFGLFGMVLVITGFVDMFKNAGLSMATINAERISHEQINTLFWLNLLISVLLGISLLAGAPLVAMFYGRPELTAVTAVLSVSFVFSGFTIQHQALLYRHMRFGALAVIQITMQAVNMVVAIILASLGWSYWALVAGVVSGVIAGAVVTFFYCPWMPSRMKRGSGAFSMITFGGQLTVGNVVRYLSENMDKLLIGKFIGTNPLGLYTKAYQLYSMPIKQIRAPLASIAMPVLSSIRNQPDRYARYYQHLLNALASLTIPSALYCMLEADFLIPLFLGSQWLEAVPVFRILSIAALIYPVAQMRGMVLVSMGRSQRFWRFELVNAVLCVASFVVGLPFGIEGVAGSYAMMIYAIFIPSLFYCFHKTPVTVTLFIKTLILPLCLSFLAGTAAVFTRYVNSGNLIAGHLMFLIVFAGIYIMTSCCRRSLRDIMAKILKELITFFGRSSGTGIAKVKLEI